MQRVVEPEILDSLPHDAPRAIRSRRDLRLLNSLMGNHRWITRTLEKNPEWLADGIIELGAGDGTLARSLAEKFPDTPVHACDLAPAPPDIAPVHWHQGDLFESPPDFTDKCVVANLFLHHFEERPLRLLGKHLSKARALVLCEPARQAKHLFLSKLLHPFVNDVTRHDMPASIRAGFRANELFVALRFQIYQWRWRVQSTNRGAYRMTIWRNK